MHLLLLLLLGDDALLVLGKSPSHGAGLLGAEVEREVLLVLVEDTELRTLVDVDDGEDTGDRLADVVAVEENLSERGFFCFLSNSNARVWAFGDRVSCPSLPPHHPWLFPEESNAHSVKLGRTGAGNLLGAELNQLGLQLIQLLLELILVLAPELGGLDFGRLWVGVSNSSSWHSLIDRFGEAHHFELLRLVRERR